MPNAHDTLGELFSDIADAIRGKTGESAEIVADNFPASIAGIDTTQKCAAFRAAGTIVNGNLELVAPDTITITNFRKATIYLEQSTSANVTFWCYRATGVIGEANGSRASFAEYTSSGRIVIPTSASLTTVTTANGKIVVDGSASWWLPNGRYFVTLEVEE